MEREHKVTAARTNNPFDQMLSGMIGLPNGAHTKVAAIQHIDFYGNTTTYNVQTVRTDEDIVAFVTVVNAEGSQRFIVPQRVLALIDRQRNSITSQLRRRHGKRLAEERAADGIQPGFMRKKK